MARQLTQAESQLNVAPVIVVALGTSLTETGGWLEPLGRVAAERWGRPLTVLNFGKSGANSLWGVGQVERIIATRPDVVLIEFSVNDASWLKGVSLSQSRRNTEEIVARIRGELPRTKIYLMTMNPVYGLRRWIRPRLKAYYDLYGELAKGLGVGQIDNRPAWSRLTRAQLTRAVPDGSHPIPEMTVQLVVPTIVKAIANLD
jgi:acyl-CoA thioesterase I